MPHTRPKTVNSKHSSIIEHVRHLGWWQIKSFFLSLTEILCKTLLLYIGNQDLQIVLFQNTISELFSEPSGLDSLVKEKEQEEREKQEKANRPQRKQEQKKPDNTEQQALAQFEKVVFTFRNYHQCCCLLGLCLVICKSQIWEK